jgi:hypothetical protein
MKVLRILNRILCYVPFVCVVCFFVMVSIGILKLKKIPVYGVDPDPYSMSIDWINLIMLFSMLISVFSIPLNIFIAVILYFKRIHLARSDKIALLIPFFSIGIFYFCKYYLPNLFEWVLD